MTSADARRLLERLVAERSTAVGERHPRAGGRADRRVLVQEGSLQLRHGGGRRRAAVPGRDWGTDPEVYKRDSVSTFVDRLVREQEDHQDLLLALMVDVAAMQDFPQLRRAEDPEPKIAAAREAVARIREVIQPYEQALAEQQAARERITAARAGGEQRRATTQRLGELKSRSMELVGMAPRMPGGDLGAQLGTRLAAGDPLDQRSGDAPTGQMPVRLRHCP